MKKIIILVLILAMHFSGCKKVEVKDLLQDLTLSKTEVPADGETIISMSVTVSEKSSTDRRSVVFRADDGTFISSGSKSCTVQAQFIDGKLIAKTNLRVSNEPGTIQVSAEPEFDSPIQEYQLKASFISKPSVADSLLLVPSSFAIAPNFSTQVKILGYIFNSTGKGISAGTRVIFKDFLLNGAEANGRFNLQHSVVTDSSVVIAYYSANTFSNGTVIKIRATIPETAVRDSFLLNINQ